MNANKKIKKAEKAKAAAKAKRVKIYVASAVSAVIAIVYYVVINDVQPLLIKEIVEIKKSVGGSAVPVRNIRTGQNFPSETLAAAHDNVWQEGISKVINGLLKTTGGSSYERIPKNA